MSLWCVSPRVSHSWIKSRHNTWLRRIICLMVFKCPESLDLGRSWLLHDLTNASHMARTLAVGGDSIHVVAAGRLWSWRRALILVTPLFLASRTEFRYDSSSLSSLTHLRFYGFVSKWVSLQRNVICCKATHLSDEWIQFSLVKDDTDENCNKRVLEWMQHLNFVRFY